MWSRVVRVIVTLSLGILTTLLTADAQPQRKIPDSIEFSGKTTTC